MGKLNYTHRKISGLKLGTAVKKDVLKHSQAASKTRLAKDPHLEVNLFKKALGDDGLAEACDGLQEALSSGTLRLDELHLAENNITLVGLKHLSKVIKLASNDIKDLDLRANELRIVTVEDARVWECFLESFKDVCSLRRLDISENPIGDRGVEILWRVYSREPPIVLPKLLRSGSIRSDSSEDGSDTENGGVFDEDLEMDPIYEQARKSSIPENEFSVSNTDTTSSKQDVELNSPVSPLSSGHTQGVELHGLRGIPYIILSGVGATDSTALFLSYILPIHPTPEGIMPYITPPKPGCQADILQNYYSLNCRGIVYNPNDNLSHLSQRVLESAETLREGKTVKLVTDTELSPYRPRNRRNSDGGAVPHVVRARRDSSSFLLTHHTPSSSSPLELERARCKIQGAILRENGIHCVALWSATLRMLVVSRIIMFDPNAGPYEACRRNFSRRLPLLSPGSPSQSTISTNHAKKAAPPSPTRGSSNSTEFHPINVCTTTPQVTMPLGEPPVGLPVKEESLHKDEDSQSNEDKLEDSTMRILPGKLPEHIWIKIIVLAADPDGLLSDRQHSNVVKWAKTRSTLDKEREVAGKLKSVQIWRTLESTGCLAYDGK